MQQSAAKHSGPGAHRRVRIALHAMLVLAIVLLLGNSLKSEKIGRLGMTDLEIMSIAAEQSLLTERIAMTSAVVTLERGADAQRIVTLSDTVARAQGEAQRMDQLLREQGLLGMDAHAGFRDAYSAWLAVRGRVWLQTQLVVWHANLRDGLGLELARQGVEQEMGAVRLATDTLLDQARMAAQSRSRSALDQAHEWTLITLLVLLTVTLAVTEMAARSLKRQHLALAQKIAEAERLALVAEHTSNGVAIADAAGQVQWVNHAFVAMHGYTLDEIRGRTVVETLGGEQSNADSGRRFTTDPASGLSAGNEILMAGKDGVARWFEADVQPFYDAVGKVAGWISVHTDITDQVSQRQKMAILLDALPAGVVVQSLTGAIVDVNMVASEILGLSRESLVSGGLRNVGWHMVNPDLTPTEATDAPPLRTLQTGKGLRGEVVGLAVTGGNMRWLTVNTELLRDAQGQPAGVVSCFVDITDSRSQQQLLTLAMDGAALGSWEFDLATGAMHCSDRMFGIMGYEGRREILTPRVWKTRIHPDDLSAWTDAVKTHLDNQELSPRMELRLKHQDGRWVWTLFSGTVVMRNTDGQASRMAGVCMDIDAQKHLESQLRDSARTDELTLMPNRAVVMERVRGMIERAKVSPGYNFGVLFMDFDRFKQVNDTLGHGAGDELLRQIAKRLENSLRPGDAFTQSGDFDPMAARMGGDEFVVVLDDIRGDLDAEVVAGRLVDVLAQPYVIGENTVNSSVSIGIVTSLHAVGDMETVLRDADIAMYEAKRAGRGRYVMFEPSMHKRARDNVALENDLRQALDNGEIFVVYQPLVDLGSGALTGMEALVRWQHPQRGMVSPVEFIPVAEAGGLIGSLGLFVLRTACAEFMKMQQALGPGMPPGVAVNLSRAQLRQAGLATVVLEAMREFGVAPSQLTLEVTESLAAQDHLVQTTLHEIRALGVALALDDFGTGYSSLSCLHELPVDTVKIDRSFVSQAQTSDYHRVLIEATIRMAQALGLGTVAEGIETQEQAALMKLLGCAKGQGYLYSKPLEREALVQWIRARNTPL